LSLAWLEESPGALKDEKRRRERMGRRERWIEKMRR